MGRLNYEISDLVRNNLTYKHTKVSAIIDEFIESGADIAEYVTDNGEYKNNHSSRNVLDINIRKRHLRPVVGVRESNGHVYLVRKDKIDG